MDRFFTLFRYFAPPNYHEKAGVSSSFSERRHKFTSAKEIVGKSHIFQSKHSVRCTLGVSSILSQPRFNPHSHMGSDVCIFEAGVLPKRFNPHSHMGRSVDIRKISVDGMD